LSAGVLSFLLWHVHWSRTGLETILIPFFSIALLGLIAWAWQKKTWWAFALSGAVLGLSQYTNPGARVLPVQALITFVILGARFLPIMSFRAAKPRGISGADEEIPRPFGARNDISFASFVIYGFVFLLASLIVYAPLAWFFINNPDWFFNRIAYTSENARAGGLSFYIDSGIKTLLSLNLRGDVMQRHNLSLRPVFDPLLSLWMFVGLAAMFVKRDRLVGHLVLLSAIAINLAPMVFSDGAPGFGRTLGASPLVSVLPALGMMLALEWRRHVKWIVIASLIISASLNLFDYFVRYPNQPGMFDSYEVGLWTLIQNATRAESAYLVLNEPSIQHPATRMARELATNDLRIINGETCWAYPARTLRETTFAVQRTWIDPLRAQFKKFSSRQEVMHEPESYLDGLILRVPQDEVSVSGAPDALATFGDILDLIALDAPNDTSAGATMTLQLRWRSTRVPPTRYTTFVHLTSRDKPFITGVDGEPCAGGYPTNQWHANEVVEYKLTLKIPEGLPPDGYDIMIGVYDTATAERLLVSQTNQREADRAFVKTLIVNK
jgi:hypothetical protein